MGPRFNASTIGRWVSGPGPAASPAVRLLCLPFAGGGGSIYRTWLRGLPGDLDICPVTLPGREHRRAEAPATSMPDLVTAMMTDLAALFDRPIALFGHSIGALLAFEMASRLAAEGRPPVHVFVSGRRPPDVPDPEMPDPSLPDPQFLEGIRRYGALPDAVEESPALRGEILPLLRADLSLARDYRPPAPLPGVALTALSGIDDATAPPPDMEGWSRWSTGPFEILPFPGNHFFLRLERDAVLASLVVRLTEPR